MMLRLCISFETTSQSLHQNIYDIFTEKSYSKPVERNLLSIPVTRRRMTLNNVKIAMALNSLIGSSWRPNIIA